MKLLICFGAILTVVNAGLLGALHAISGRSGGKSPLGGHIETIRVIQEYTGHVPQFVSHGVGLPSGGEHVNTIRVIQENGGHIPHHVNTVRVIQEGGPIASHSLDVDHPVDGGHVETIRLIEEPVHNSHRSVDGHVDTVHVIQEGGHIGSNSFGGGHPVNGGHVETIRLIQEPVENAHGGIDGRAIDGSVDTVRVIQENVPFGSPTVGIGQSLGGVEHVETIRLIHEPVGHVLGGWTQPVEPLNNGHVETIRVIQNNVVNLNHLSSGPIGGGHALGGDIQTIRVIKHFSPHNIQQPHGNLYEQAEHNPEGHTKIIHIIAAASGNKVHWK